jgi:uncharacterized protein YyaL (SSP411 family)
MDPPDRERPSNRLAAEASPYLLQHAHNPVDWFPWGSLALDAARDRDVPILLSIGYSACHWCHVMERESFENEAIARVMNDRFVCIKVDREERPDLDHIYQLVVQLTGRSGGWPLTVFLTPDQKPFFGGTYFPPAERHGMPGFPRILQAVADAYATRRSDVLLQAKELADAIGRISASADRKVSQLDAEVLAGAAAKLSTRFDDQHGGFGSRPKFPNTMPLEVLLRHATEDGDTQAEGRVRRALGAMRAGGVYDQLGGGFHRYSTDESWSVPHFEKMLYDNALLLRLYVDAFRAFSEARYAETALATARYVLAEMTDGEGGFYATQDADSEGEEGRFFVWTPDQVKDAMAGHGDLATLAMEHWGITPGGNFERSASTVLYEAKGVAELAVAHGRAPSEIEADLARAKARLLDARERRVKPFRDEKILASWNGLMIGAMTEASAALTQPDLLAAAKKAFAFVLRVLVDDRGPRLEVMRHAKGGVIKGPGFLDDYSFLVSAALDLYEATGEPSYVITARRLADRMLELFWDEGGGSFFFTPEGGETLIVRAKDPFDQAIPSGASIAMHALLRLSSLVGEVYGSVAALALERVSGAASDNPFAFGQTLCALDRLVRGAVDVVLVGPREDPRTRALAETVFARYVPNRTLAWLDPSDAASREACAALAEGKSAKGEPAAYVCRGRACSLPVTDPSDLAKLLLNTLSAQHALRGAPASR